MSKQKIGGTSVSHRFLKKIVDRAVVPLVRYVRQQSTPGETVFTELERRTARECADYAQERMARAVNFSQKSRVWDYALSKAALNGLFVEFGVFQGNSINHIGSVIAGRGGLSSRVYGFDSFEGLQEDWSGHTCTKGHFSVGGMLPTVRDNVTLIKGWFDQTLPGFLREHPGEIAFMHVDSDTYEAARIVFNLCGDRLVAGTVVLFDEYFGYRGWREGEYKAWQEFVQAAGIQYEYLAFSGEQAALKILARGRPS